MQWFVEFHSVCLETAAIHSMDHDVYWCFPNFCMGMDSLAKTTNTGRSTKWNITTLGFHGCILDITVQSDITRTGLFNRPQWGFYDLRGYSNKLASDLARQMEIPEKHRASKIGQSWTTMGDMSIARFDHERWRYQNCSVYPIRTRFLGKYPHLMCLTYVMSLLLIRNFLTYSIHFFFSAKKLRGNKQAKLIDMFVKA